MQRISLVQEMLTLRVTTTGIIRNTMFLSSQENPFRIIQPLSTKEGSMRSVWEECSSVSVVNSGHCTAQCLWPSTGASSQLINNSRHSDTSVLEVNEKSNGMQSCGPLGLELTTEIIPTEIFPTEISPITFPAKLLAITCGLRQNACAKSSFYKQTKQNKVQLVQGNSKVWNKDIGMAWQLITQQCLQ